MLTRAVLFVGHKFNSKISFFSEMELENGKVEGGKLGGEIAMEQAFLKFDINRDLYIVAGLFIPRIGLINENHLPNTFNGVERTQVETYIIPATWREVGIGVYGRVPAIDGLNYSFALMNGFNVAGLESGTGWREGPYLGFNASAANLGVTGSLLYYWNDFRFQASGYYAGGVGITPRVADSLHIDRGVFGIPVWLTEANMVYRNQGLEVKALGAINGIPDAADVNRVFANNVAKRMYGAYVEMGYDILHKSRKHRSLTPFARYETLNMNAELPENGVENGALNQQYLFVGASYKPVRGVVIKADVMLRSTGDLNRQLQFTPYPVNVPYYKNNALVNLGIGYSF